MAQVLAFLQAHGGVLSALAVAILDLVFALNPKADAADGLLHAVYLWVKGLSSKPNA